MWHQPVTGYFDAHSDFLGCNSEAPETLLTGSPCKIYNSPNIIGEGITLFQGSDQASWLNETDADTLLNP